MATCVIGAVFPHAWASKKVEVSRRNNKRVILSVANKWARRNQSLMRPLPGCRRGIFPEEAELVIVGVQPPSKDPNSGTLFLQPLSPDVTDGVRLVAMAEPEALNAYYAGPRSMFSPPIWSACRSRC